MKINNRRYFYFTLVWTLILCALIQAGMIVGVILVGTDAGNFAFMLYILVGILSAASWIFICWRSTHIARTETYRLEDGTVTVTRDFIKKEETSFPVGSITGAVVRARKNCFDVTLFINLRKVKLRFMSDEDTLALLGEMNVLGEEEV